MKRKTKRKVRNLVVLFRKVNSERKFDTSWKIIGKEASWRVTRNRASLPQRQWNRTVYNLTTNVFYKRAVCLVSERIGSAPSNKFVMCSSAAPFASFDHFLPPIKIIVHFDLLNPFIVTNCNNTLSIIISNVHTINRIFNFIFTTFHLSKTNIFSNEFMRKWNDKSEIFNSPILFSFLITGFRDEKSLEILSSNEIEMDM